MPDYNGKNLKWLAVLLFFAAVFLVVLSAGVPRAHAEEALDRLITVTGQAEIYVKPDVASVGLGVETNGATAQEAQKLNASAMTGVIGALKEKGIDDKDIQTSNLSLFPVYEFQTSAEAPKGKSVLVGYRCNNTVHVRVKDVGNVGGLIDSAVTSGATNVHSISFGVLDSKKYEDQALGKAVENAKHKAEVLAQAAGVKIKGVLRITDGYVHVATYGPEMMGDSRLMKSEVGSPVEPGEVVITSNVGMDFTF